jgi:hypothetical protein
VDRRIEVDTSGAGTDVLDFHLPKSVSGCLRSLESYNRIWCTTMS